MPEISDGANRLTLPSVNQPHQLWIYATSRFQGVEPPQMFTYISHLIVSLIRFSMSNVAILRAAL